MAKVYARFRCHCLRCDHGWISTRWDKDLAHLKPARCPSCRSPYWQQPRRVPAGNQDDPLTSAKFRAEVAYMLRRFRRAAKLARTKRERIILERGQVAVTGLLRRYNAVVDGQRKRTGDAV